MISKPSLNDDRTARASVLTYEGDRIFDEDGPALGAGKERNTSSEVRIRSFVVDDVEVRPLPGVVVKADIGGDEVQVGVVLNKSAEG